MRRYFQFELLLAGVVSVLASCDSPDRINSVSTAPQRTVQAGPALLEEEQDAAAPVQNNSSATAPLQASRTIGAEGGWLVLQGVQGQAVHKLWVSPGAVDRPTMFTITRVPSEYVMVQLKAQQVVNGKVVDVTPASFAQPIMLSLSYAGTKLQNTQHLSIAQVADNGDLIKVPTTLSLAPKTAVSQVKRMSRYAICAD